MPKEERAKLYIGNIYDNSAICRQCGDKIRSKNKHHYTSCSCGALSVDGGSHYLRRSAKDFNNIIEAYILFNDAKDSQ